MKFLRGIFSVILVLAVFLASFAGSLYFFDQGTYSFENEDVAVFDEDSSRYYLQKAAKDIIFRLNCDKAGMFGYALVDEQGAAVQTKIRKTVNNSYDILPPPEGYIEGARYTLYLPDGVSFESEYLKDARSLVFSVEKKPVERYEFTDMVVRVDSTIGEVKGSKLDVRNFAVNAGEILFGQDENKEYVVYKITDIGADGMATVSCPAIDEIYSELEIYGEYLLSAEDIVINPELEAEIIKNYEQSAFFKALTQAAYADDEQPGTSAERRFEKTEFNIAHKPESNSVEIELTTTFEPGEDGLFGICTLKNQKVSFTLFAEIELSASCNIQGAENWDISVDNKTKFSWNFDISLLEEYEGEDELASLFSEDSKSAGLIDYKNNAAKLTEKLSKLTADVNVGEIELFEWIVQIPGVPGLSFVEEFKLCFESELVAEMDMDQSYETAYKVGASFADNELKSYSNRYRNIDELNLSMCGKANIKTGVKHVFKLALINSEIMYVKLEPQIGYYMDGFLTRPISGLDKTDKEIMEYIYLEQGLYVAAEIGARVNYLPGVWEKSFDILEEKFPFWKLGTENLAVGLSPSAENVLAINNIASAPEISFGYLDVGKGVYTSEKLPLNEIIFFTSDGTQLQLIDGKLQFADTVTADGVAVTAKYMHTNGKEYSVTFNVSAYDVFKDLADKTFVLSSGVGAWGTHFKLAEDGSFKGNYHDTDMGDAGKNYPQGTIYSCDFSGRFRLVEKMDEFTYKLELEYLNIDGPQSEKIENNVRIIPAEPHGLLDGKTFMLYTPGAPTSELPREYIDWVKVPNLWYDSAIPKKLPLYGIYNVEEQMGFFSTKAR